MAIAAELPSKGEEKLLAFLRSPSSYAHRPAHVRLHETHASWVFIASPFVFKVKKPVNLGFLDFSTLEKRRFFCARELELNRRLCPEIYLEVVPIYRSGDELSFGAGGDVVEYALRMRELSPGWFLDELLAKGAVGESEINRIVGRLRPFYASQNPTPEIEEWGRREKLKISTDENFAQVEQFVRQTLSPLALETIRHYTDCFYAANARLFDERIEERRILDCHGDLRLEHVHITSEAVSIFDCIEFNDRLRFIDIANDLAFLAMGFDFAGRRDLAHQLLETAAREFSDPSMAKLTDFYKCYRAVVRGKVESIQAISQQTANAWEHATRAGRYFRLALRYAIARSEPMLLVVMGRIATGKTTLARTLASELAWPAFSSDRIRKHLAGVPITERTTADRRAEIYSGNMTQQTYHRLAADGLRAARESAGAVIDATFGLDTYREFVSDECRNAGVKLQIIEVSASDELIVDRLRERAHSQGEISDARLEDFPKLNAAYQPPVEVSNLIRVSAVDKVDETARATLLQLAERSARNV